MNLFIYIHHKVRNVIAFLKGKTFLTFLFFLGLSTAFWFFEVSKEIQTIELNIPLRLKNVPDNVVVTTDLPSSVRIKVKGANSSLIYYRYLNTFEPAIVDFATYKNPSGHVRVPQEDVLRSISNMFSAETELQALKPDTLEYFYSFGAKKEVPVSFQGKLQTKDGYYIYSQTSNPTAVTVYATEQILDSMAFALTEPRYLSEIDQSGSLLLNMQRTKGVKFVPDTVRLTYVVDRLIEKTLSLPIVAINFPSNQQLRTFPMRVNITFQVGTQEYRNISENDFTLAVDGEQLNSNSDSNTIPLTLIKKPDNVYGVRLHQSEVEYLIEETNTL